VEALLLPVCGLALLAPFVALWLVVCDTAERVGENRTGACVECGYALDGLSVESRCPECGRMRAGVRAWRQRWYRFSPRRALGAAAVCSAALLAPWALAGLDRLLPWAWRPLAWGLHPDAKRAVMVPLLLSTLAVLIVSKWVPPRRPGLATALGAAGAFMGVGAGAWLAARWREDGEVRVVCTAALGALVGLAFAGARWPRRGLTAEPVAAADPPGE
jgi:hypothetical protein